MASIMSIVLSFVDATVRLRIRLDGCRRAAKLDGVGTAVLSMVVYWAMQQIGTVRAFTEICGITAIQTAKI